MTLDHHNRGKSNSELDTTQHYVTHCQCFFHNTCPRSKSSSPKRYTNHRSAIKNIYDLELLQLTFNAKYGLSRYIKDAEIEADIEAGKKEADELRAELHAVEEKDLNHPSALREAFLGLAYEEIDQLTNLLSIYGADHQLYRMLNKLGGVDGIQRRLDATDKLAYEIGLLGGIDEVKNIVKKVTDMGGLKEVQA